MKLDSNAISVGELFRREFIFQVPRYQRGYTWDEPQVSDFVRDIDRCFQARVGETPRPHFFGGLVCVSTKQAGSMRHDCELIDGQQRITTFVLLIRAIERYYSEIAYGLEQKTANSAKAARSLAESRANHLRALFLETRLEVSREYKSVDRLTVSNPDQEYFRRILHSDDMPAHDDKERVSHERLLFAYEQIDRWLRNAIPTSHSIAKKMEGLLKLAEVVFSDAIVIAIFTESRTDAYRLFQVLNDRGTQLTEGDLLRASTLEMLGDNRFQQQHESVALSWDEILEDHPRSTEEFLRWHFASVEGHRPGQSSLFDEYFASFFEELSPVTTNAHAKRVSAQVQSIVSEYRTCDYIREGDWPYSDNPKATAWQCDRLSVLVRELRHTNCLPLLMAARLLKESQFTEVVDLVERFAFRYKLICGLHITSLTTIYHEESVAIRHSPQKYRLSSLRAKLKQLQDRKAPDVFFSTQLERQLQYHPDEGNRLLKYFLSTLEHYWNWNEAGGSGSPKCKDQSRIIDLSVSTIEHVYSQNAQTKVPALEAYVNDLGNLTLVSNEENTLLGNKDFVGKQPIFAKSTSAMNRAIGRMSTWTKVNVEQRRADLIKQALKIYSM